MIPRALSVPVALAALTGAFWSPLTRASPKNVPLKATLNVEKQLGQLPNCLGANNRPPGRGARSPARAKRRIWVR